MTYSQRPACSRWKDNLAAILRNAPSATMRFDGVRRAQLWTGATLSREKPGANGEPTLIRGGESYNPRTLNGRGA